jgi:AraC-like DNA-binding protein
MSKARNALSGGPTLIPGKMLETTGICPSIRGRSMTFSISSRQKLVCQIPVGAISIRAKQGAPDASSGRGGEAFRDVRHSVMSDAFPLESRSDDFSVRVSRWDGSPDIDEREMASRSVPPDSEFSKAVQTALDYMNTNFARPIMLRDLSELTGCTPAQIIRAFRKTVGITPHAWLIRRRVLQGKVLIELGVSIATAASEVGFFDQTHFTRHFKKLHGHTPARYRNSLWSVARSDSAQPRKGRAGRSAARTPR